MRVTNHMMTTNMLNNIGRNKQNISTLGDQYSTGQKIQRPSEDPVVAVRSLKYRTQLKELEQYYSKNIPDAKSWMNVTESALDSVNDLLTQMNKYFNQGANDTLEVKDRDSIIETVKEYTKQIYQYGNTDYAGRYVFTGYRTDTPLLFEKGSTDLKYEIKENFTGEQIEEITYVSGEAQLDPTKTAEDYAANPPDLKHAYRLRLSYDNLDKDGGQIPTINLIAKADGSDLPIDPADIVVKAPTDKDAYEALDGKINYIPETGELVISESMYAKMQGEDGIKVSYEKTQFKGDEVRPEHYFACKTVDSNGKEIEYSYPGNQEIQYEINFSQKLTVNTMACNSISLDIKREVDEIVRVAQVVSQAEGKLAQVKLKIEGAKDSEEKKTLEALKEQIETELTLKKKVLQEKFESGIGMTKEQQDTVNVAVANHGSRYVRLELTEERLSNQKVDFTEMLKNNDSVNLEDAIINYNAAQVTYNASLSSAAKVVTNTLLDFL